MCGRFSQAIKPEKLANDLGIPAEYFPKKIVRRYNLAPSMPTLAITERSKKPHVDYMQWGLVPMWAKDPTIGSKMINARSETVTEKPSFRGLFKNSRCLIPADGFFEWKKEGSRKQPYFIRMKSEKPFTFAGLWSHWAGPDGSELITCTILTTSPNKFLQGLHHRMPVILAPDKRSEWLDTSCYNKEQLKSLLAPYPSEEMEAYPVSTFVNSPRNDKAECLQGLNHEA